MSALDKQYIIKLDLNKGSIEGYDLTFKNYSSDNGKKHLIERDDLATGCVDKLDFCFLKWAFTFNNDYAPKLLEVINKYPNVDVKIFNKREDALNFIENL